MVKSKFAQICDTIFFVLGFSFVVYAWINKYIKINLLSFVLTVVLSIVVAWIIWTASTNKINKTEDEILNIGRRVESLQRVSEFSPSTTDVAFAKANHDIKSFRGFYKLF